MNYKKETENKRKINLIDAGEYFTVYIGGLETELINKLDKEGFLFDDDESSIWMSQFDIDRLNVPYEAINWSANLFKEEEREDVLASLIKDADHYLVMANNCRWNGASGYKFADSREDAIYRDYDVSIYPETASKGGKVLICREYSHDVPMGARTTIIGLTDREYERLSYWDVDWETVQKFVEKQEEKIAS